MVSIEEYVIYLEFDFLSRRLVSLWSRFGTESCLDDSGDYCFVKDQYGDRVLSIGVFRHTFLCDELVNASAAILENVRDGWSVVVYDWSADAPDPPKILRKIVALNGGIGIDSEVG